MCGIGQEITVVTCARGDTCSQGSFTSIDPAEGPGGGTVVHSSDRDISADGCSGGAGGYKDGGGAPGGGGGGPPDGGDGGGGGGGGCGPSGCF